MARGAWLIWWGCWWWDDDGEVAACCEESWRRCKLGGHRSFLLQFQAMVSQEEDDDDIQGLPVWKWKNWKAKETKIQAKQELWKQVELMRFRKMACNSATALVQRAGKRMTKICANYPPYLSPPRLPFYRLKKQAKVVTPFVASSLWPFLYPQKILLLRTKVHHLISPFLIWIWRGCCICKVEVGVVGWLNDGQVGFSFCPALHFTSLDRRLPPDPFLRASPNFHTTIISPPMDTSV